jgi:hypothetical protein
LVSEDSKIIKILVFPADCPHFKIVTTFNVVLEDTRSFQHIASFFRQLLFLVVSIFDSYQNLAISVPIIAPLFLQRDTTLGPL